MSLTLIRVLFSVREPIWQAGVYQKFTFISSRSFFFFFFPTPPWNGLFLFLDTRWIAYELKFSSNITASGRLVWSLQNKILLSASSSIMHTCIRTAIWEVNRQDPIYFCVPIFYQVSNKDGFNELSPWMNKLCLSCVFLRSPPTLPENVLITLLFSVNLWRMSKDLVNYCAPV